jgi:protein involved in polysaccharide export with SLBB domain
MLKCKSIFYIILAFISLQGCSQILEPVLLNTSAKFSNKVQQEEFDINIDTLTFEKASEANKDPYPRQVMLTGSGARANVLDESNFLRSDVPKHLTNEEYLLGFGDKLSFSLISEYLDQDYKWPADYKKTKYVLGVGDKLTFIQVIDADTSNIGVTVNDAGDLEVSSAKDNIITTSGVVGTNGKVLLLGIGTISVQNKTLDKVRTEVRNILIRNGLTPNFQLEITDFQSKKAFLATKGTAIQINNIPISLQEVALGTSVSQSDKNSSLVMLTRQKKEYRLTAEQLFDERTPEIFIQDNDIINITKTSPQEFKHITRVGLKGNILLPQVGNLKASNRTIDDLHKEISEILIKKGLKPNFQLELVDFKSKKVYVVQKNQSSKIIPLTNVKINLKDLILQTTNLTGKPDSLFTVLLKRDEKSYRFTLDKILNPKTPNIWIQGDDQIEIEQLIYKPGQVFALSGNGRAQIVPINPSKRETLANIIFSKAGVLNDITARRSEIYLLRGRNPAVAYHLDAQNVSRILVAAKTELRPNDIIYSAERPIISFSRVLAEITPLRILLRDIDEGNIP